MQELEKLLFKKNIPIYSIGDPGDLTYNYTIIGNKLTIFKKILNKERRVFKKITFIKKTNNYYW